MDPKSLDSNLSKNQDSRLNELLNELYKIPNKKVSDFTDKAIRLLNKTDQVNQVYKNAVQKATKFKLKKQLEIEKEQLAKNPPVITATLSKDDIEDIIAQRNLNQTNKIKRMATLLAQPATIPLVSAPVTVAPVVAVAPVTSVADLGAISTPILKKINDDIKLQESQGFKITKTAEQEITSEGVFEVYLKQGVEENYITPEFKFQEALLLESINELSNDNVTLNKDLTRINNELEILKTLRTQIPASDLTTVYGVNSINNKTWEFDMWDRFLIPKDDFNKSKNPLVDPKSQLLNQTMWNYVSDPDFFKNEDEIIDTFTKYVKNPTNNFGEKIKSLQKVGLLGPAASTMDPVLVFLILEQQFVPVQNVAQQKRFADAIIKYTNKSDPKDLLKQIIPLYPILFPFQLESKDKVDFVEFETRIKRILFTFQDQKQKLLSKPEIKNANFTEAELDQLLMNYFISSLDDSFAPLLERANQYNLTKNGKSFEIKNQKERILNQITKLESSKDTINQNIKKINLKLFDIKQNLQDISKFKFKTNINKKFYYDSEGIPIPIDEKSNLFGSLSQIEKQILKLLPKNIQDILSNNDFTSFSRQDYLQADSALKNIRGLTTSVNDANQIAVNRFANIVQTRIEILNQLYDNRQIIQDSRAATLTMFIAENVKGPEAFQSIVDRNFSEAKSEFVSIIQNEVKSSLDYFSGDKSQEQIQNDLNQSSKKEAESKAELFKEEKRIEITKQAVVLDQIIDQTLSDLIRVEKPINPEISKPLKEKQQLKKDYKLKNEVIARVQRKNYFKNQKSKQKENEKQDFIKSNLTNLTTNPNPKTFRKLQNLTVQASVIPLLSSIFSYNTPNTKTELTEDKEEEEEIITTKDRLKELKSELDSVKDDIETKNKEAEKLKQDLELQEAEKIRILKERERLEELALKQKRELEESLIQKQKEIEQKNLETEREAARKKQENLKRFETKLQEIQNTKSQEEKQIQQEKIKKQQELNQILSEAKNKRSQAQLLENPAPKIAEIEKEIESAQLKTDETLKELENKKFEIEIQAQISISKSEEEKIKKLNEDTKSFQDKFTNLSLQLENTEREIQKEIENDTKQATNNIEKLEEELESVQDKTQKTKEDLENLENSKLENLQLIKNKQEDLDLEKEKYHEQVKENLKPIHEELKSEISEDLKQTKNLIDAIKSFLSISEEEEKIEQQQTIVFNENSGDGLLKLLKGILNLENRLDFVTNIQTKLESKLLDFEEYKFANDQISEKLIQTRDQTIDSLKYQIKDRNELLLAIQKVEKEFNEKIIQNQQKQELLSQFIKDIEIKLDELEDEFDSLDYDSAIEIKSTIEEKDIEKFEIDTRLVLDNDPTQEIILSLSKEIKEISPDEKIEIISHAELSLGSTDLKSELDLFSKKIEAERDGTDIKFTIQQDGFNKLFGSETTFKIDQGTKIESRSDAIKIVENLIETNPEIKSEMDLKSLPTPEQVKTVANENVEIKQVLDFIQTSYPSQILDNLSESLLTQNSEKQSLNQNLIEEAKNKVGFINANKEKTIEQIKTRNKISSNQDIVIIDDGILENITSIIIKAGVSIAIATTIAPMIYYYVSSFLTSFIGNSAIASVLGSSVGNYIYNFIYDILKRGSSDLLFSFIEWVSPKSEENWFKKLLSNPDPGLIERELYGIKVLQSKSSAVDVVSGIRYYVVDKKDKQEFEKRRAKSNQIFDLSAPGLYKFNMVALLQKTLSFVNKNLNQLTDTILMFSDIFGYFSNMFVGYISSQIVTPVWSKIKSALENAPIIGRFFKYLTEEIPESVFIIYEKCTKTRELDEASPECQNVILAFKKYESRKQKGLTLGQRIESIVQSKFSSFITSQIQKYISLDQFQELLKSFGVQSQGGVLGSILQLVTQTSQSAIDSLNYLKEQSLNFQRYVSENYYETLLSNINQMIATISPLSDLETKTIQKQFYQKENLDESDVLNLKRLNNIIEKYNSLDGVYKAEYEKSYQFAKSQIIILNEKGLLFSDSNLLNNQGVERIKEIINLNEIKSNQIYEQAKSDVSALRQQIDNHVIHSRGSEKDYEKWMVKITQGLKSEEGSKIREWSLRELESASIIRGKDATKSIFQNLAAISGETLNSFVDTLDRNSNITGYSFLDNAIKSVKSSTETIANYASNFGADIKSKPLEGTNLVEDFESFRIKYFGDSETSSVAARIAALEPGVELIPETIFQLSNSAKIEQKQKLFESDKLKESLISGIGFAQGESSRLQESISSKAKVAVGDQSTLNPINLFSKWFEAYTNIEDIRKMKKDLDDLAAEESDDEDELEIFETDTLVEELNKEIFETDTFVNELKKEIDQDSDPKKLIPWEDFMRDLYEREIEALAKNSGQILTNSIVK